MENICFILGAIGFIVLIGLGIYNFIKLSKAKRIQVVKSWLVLAVIEAEKQLGSGTGAIKIKYVYDKFISRFKILSMLISFEQFSQMVDEALEKMKFMLMSNEQLKEYINK